MLSGQFVKGAVYFDCVKQGAIVVQSAVTTLFFRIFELVLYWQNESAGAGVKGLHETVTETFVPALSAGKSIHKIPLS